MLIAGDLATHVVIIDWASAFVDVILTTSLGRSRAILLHGLRLKRSLLAPVLNTLTLRSGRRKLGVSIGTVLLWLPRTVRLCLLGTVRLWLLGTVRLWLLGTARLKLVMLFFSSRLRSLATARARTTWLRSILRFRGWLSWPLLLLLLSRSYLFSRGCATAWLPALAAWLRSILSILSFRGWLSCNRGRFSLNRSLGFFPRTIPLRLSCLLRGSSRFLCRGLFNDFRVVSGSRRRSLLSGWNSTYNM